MGISIITLALAKKFTKQSLINMDFSNFYTKEEADAAIDDKITESLGEPITDEELDSLFP